VKRRFLQGLLIALALSRFDPTSSSTELRRRGSGRRPPRLTTSAAREPLKHSLGDGKFHEPLPSPFLISPFVRNRGRKRGSRMGICPCSVLEPSRGPNPQGDQVEFPPFPRERLHQLPRGSLNFRSEAALSLECISTSTPLQEKLAAKPDSSVEIVATGDAECISSRPRHSLPGRGVDMIGQLMPASGPDL
jgi:hypothetical protein